MDLDLNRLTLLHKTQSPNKSVDNGRMIDYY